MKAKWVIALVVAAAGAALYGGTVLATNPSGVTTTTFGVGRFDDIDATTKTDVNPGHATDFWQARINTKGSSDLYVLQNTIVPGGKVTPRHSSSSTVMRAVNGVTGSKRSASSTAACARAPGSERRNSHWSGCSASRRTA